MFLRNKNTEKIKCEENEQKFQNKTNFYPFLIIQLFSVIKLSTSSDTHTRQYTLIGINMQFPTCNNASAAPLNCDRELHPSLFVPSLLLQLHKQDKDRNGLIDE